MDNELRESIRRAMVDAERKAIDSLRRYKFWMFGCHAAQCVLLNRVGGLGLPNPFKFLVDAAKAHQLPHERIPPGFHREESGRVALKPREGVLWDTGFDPNVEYVVGDRFFDAKGEVCEITAVHPDGISYANVSGSWVWGRLAKPAVYTAKEAVEVRTMADVREAVGSGALEEGVSCPHGCGQTGITTPDGLWRHLVAEHPERLEGGDHGADGK